VKSFTLRVTLQFSGLVTAAAAAVLAAGGLLLDRQHERGLELLHGIEARELVELLGDTPVLALQVAERMAHDAVGHAALFVIQVATLQGEIVFRSENLGDSILSPQAAATPHVTVTLPHLGPVHVSAVTHGPWRIQIGSPLEPGARLQRDYIDIAVLLVLAVAVVSLALGYAFARATLRPLSAIQATARRIGADNLAARIPVPEGRDELASLVRLLNEMFDRLQRSFEQIDRFTADVSHELKTPLALIRLNTEKLRLRSHVDPECHGATGDILEEVERLQQMIDRLLFLARAETRAIETAFREIAVAPQLVTFADDAEVLADERGVRFKLARNDAGSLRADPELLRQVLLNLVSNAISASPRGGLVTLQSAASASHWTFTVQDEGPGLSLDQLTRVFGRFVRFAPPAGQAPAPAPRGHGLGLAICKSIVELHDGTLRLDNRAERSGLIATVSIPRKATAA
jgi:signal transduction histidine kinase